VTIVIAAAAAVLLLAIGLIAYTRRPRQDAGLTSFRRHIEALSPESRREVMDRVRPAPPGNNGDLGKRGTADPQEPTN
jgi:MprA protease rhombosortase-interaction domain-containing protein